MKWSYLHIKFLTKKSCFILIPDERGNKYQTKADALKKKKLETTVNGKQEMQFITHYMLAYIWRTKRYLEIRLWFVCLHKKEIQQINDNKAQHTMNSVLKVVSQKLLLVFVKPIKCRINKNGKLEHQMEDGK